MKEYIYALCLTGGDPFYVGRTNDLARRMGEHTRNAAAGHTETKYQVIRRIIAGGDTWDYIVLAEIVDVNDPYEDFWVYALLCEGYQLANMKAGDAKQAAEQDAMQRMRGSNQRYSDAKTFLDARQREIEEERARQATARLNARVKKEPISNVLDWEKTLFVGEKVSQRFMSPWMRERLRSK